MNTELSSKIYYTNKYIDYLINVYIREYDLRKAGPSALLVGDCISPKQYEWLCGLSRMDRQIQTGLLLKDHPEFKDVQKQVISDARKSFISSNNLQESDILSVKNDALFIVSKVPQSTVFADGRLEFVPKNVYTSYYRYERTEMYYYLDNVSNNECIDIKNIGDDKLEDHKEFFLDFLLYIFGLAQTTSAQEVISVLQNMMNDYMCHNISLGYYREFNARSEFKINLSDFTTYYAKYLPNDVNIDLIDINYNFKMLRFFYEIFANIYFNSMKK